MLQKVRQRQSSGKSLGGGGSDDEGMLHYSRTIFLRKGGNQFHRAQLIMKKFNFHSIYGEKLCKQWKLVGGVTFKYDKISTLSLGTKWWWFLAWSGLGRRVLLVHFFKGDPPSKYQYPNAVIITIWPPVFERRSNLALRPKIYFVKNQSSAEEEGSAEGKTLADCVFFSRGLSWRFDFLPNSLCFSVVS